MRIRRHRKGRRQSKKQGKIIVSLICFMFVMVSGYAAFQTDLNIITKKNIVKTSEKCFSITDNGDGTGTIKNYDKSSGTKVKITEVINNLTITKLADTSGNYLATEVFANKEIEVSILPKTLTYIDNYAFYGDKLKHVDIPNDVTYIGSHALSIIG